MIMPVGNDSYMFWCTGCDSVHIVDARWILRGDTDKPTLTPSILVQNNRGLVCHLYLNEGNLIYLQDSNHALSGQTIPLPDFPEWMGPR